MSDLVVITGASSGLGLALARSVPFPAEVIDISRSGPPAESGITHLRADLARPGEWAAVGDEIARLIEDNDPRRAVMIHAAGTLTPIGFAGEVDATAYTSNVLLNSAAGQVLGHYFLAALSGREGTHDLIMVTSGAASSVYAGWSAYGAGKAALDHWARHAGAEQKERGGVRVSAIAPGVLDTAMQEEIRSTPERDFPSVDRFHDLHDEGDLVDPEAAARRIWDAIESGIETGSVLDIRRLS